MFLIPLTLGYHDDTHKPPPPGVDQIFVFAALQLRAVGCFTVFMTKRQKMRHGHERLQICWLPPVKSPGSPSRVYV